MSRMNRVFGFIYRQLIETPARGKTYEILHDRLELNGQVLAGRLSGKSDTAANRAVLAHIIGIERWGQRRLQILLGEPAVQDEYDSYRPDETCGLSILLDIFLRTRGESVRIAALLQQAGIPVSGRAPHNDAGSLSVAGWLTYFIQHAEIESRAIKK